MIDFFRGMPALDVITCCFAALIVIFAVPIMVYNYICDCIWERSKEKWQNEHDSTTR